MITRTLEIDLRKSKKSILLLGPRQTGKSTLIQNLSPDLTINLAHEPTFLEFARNPMELEHRLAAGSHQTVFIDEIQRLPSLLNTLQVLIDRKTGPRFLLTGSSARKLKRGHANLLPGRIHVFHLGPLSIHELGDRMNLHSALEIGTLPGIYLDPSPEDRLRTLRAYAATYIKEEIQAEALTRNLEGFSRFLFVVGQTSGQFLDFSKLSREAALPRQSALRYFEILEDTLLVHRCSAFSRNERTRLIQHPKYYFFDTGVLNAILGNFTASTDRKGLLFEHFFFNQLVTSAAHNDQDIRISSFRTEKGAEVDFIVEYGGKTWAIELKASTHVDPMDLKGLGRFRDFFGKAHEGLVAYWGSEPKTIGNVRILPWKKVFEEMGL